MKKNSKKIKSEVMEKIKSSDIKMKPKLYFVATSIFLGVGLALITLFVMLFINAVFFHMRVYRPIGYLGLGSPGFRAFVYNLPLIHLTVAIFGILIGLKLIKNYDVSYKRNFKYLAIFVVTMIVTLAFLLDKINIGDRLARSKSIRPLFMHEMMHSPWVAGEIVESNGNWITIKTHFGRVIKLNLSEEINTPGGYEFEIGEVIRAVGEWDDDLFIVKGIVGKPSGNPSGPVKGYKNFKQLKPIR